MVKNFLKMLDKVLACLNIWRYNLHVKKQGKSHKLFVTNVDSLDWKDYGVDSIIKTVTEHKHLGNGSIILCHNGAKYTAQALDMLIAKLKNEGYTFVPISELIYKDKYHMNHEGRQIKN